MLNVKINSKAKMTADEIKQNAVVKKRGMWIKDRGIQDLTIDSITNKKKDGTEMTCVDPTWSPVLITLSNTKGQKITHYMLVPNDASRNFVFQAPNKDPNFKPLQKIVNFLTGLGVEIENYGRIVGLIDHFFGANIKANLVGQVVKADIQYQGLNINYMGKDNNKEHTLYQLFNWDRPYEIREGEEAPILTGYEACENHAISLGIKKENITPFPKIKEFLEGSSSLKTTTLSDDGAESDDLPF